MAWGGKEEEAEEGADREHFDAPISFRLGRVTKSFDHVQIYTAADSQRAVDVLNEFGVFWERRWGEVRPGCTYMSVRITTE